MTLTNVSGEISRAMNSSDLRLPLTAAEGEDALHQFLGAATRLADLVETHHRRVTGADILASQLDVAEDGTEDVVEVVRDAAGQRAEGFHLLRCAQLRLQCPALPLGVEAIRDIVGHAAHDRTGFTPRSNGSVIFP